MVKAIMIPGTGAGRRVSDQYYRRIANRFGKARIMPIPGLGLRAPIPETAELLRQEIVSEFGGKQLWIAGHSQGGLHAAELALSLPEGQVTRVVALGTPFGGAPMARLERLIIPVGPMHVVGLPLAPPFRGAVHGLAPAIRDMQPDSTYILGLRKRLHLIRERLASLAFEDDHIVPEGSTYVEGATNYFVGTVSALRHAQARGQEYTHVQSGPRGTRGHILSMLLQNPHFGSLLDDSWRRSQEAANPSTVA